MGLNIVADVAVSLLSIYGRFLKVIDMSKVTRSDELERAILNYDTKSHLIDPIY